MRCHPARWLWGLIPIAMLSWLAVHLQSGSIERDLEQRSETALAAAGHDWASVAFSGRDGLLVGHPASMRLAEEASAVVRGVWGVRVVETRVAVIGAPDLPIQHVAEIPVPAAHPLRDVRPTSSPLVEGKGVSLAVAATAAEPRGVRTSNEKPAETVTAREVELPTTTSAAEAAPKQSEPSPPPQAAAQATVVEAAPPAASPALPAVAIIPDTAPPPPVAKAAAVEAAPPVVPPPLPAAVAADAPPPPVAKTAAIEAASPVIPSVPSAAAIPDAPPPPAPAAKAAAVAVAAPPAPAPPAPQLPQPKSAAIPKPPLPERSPRIDTAALPVGNTASDMTCVSAVQVAAQKVEVHFAHGRAKLDNAGKTLVDGLVGALNVCPEVVLRISGHTDDIGQPRRNLALSRQRARTVTAYMAHKGIDARRLVAIGYGEKRPAAPNDTQANRAKNRRIEVAVTTRVAPLPPMPIRKQGTEHGLSHR